MYIYWFVCVMYLCGFGNVTPCGGYFPDLEFLLLRNYDAQIGLERSDLALVIQHTVVARIGHADS